MENKIIKGGMAVIVLRGRQAGKKAIVYRTAKKAARNKFETAIIVGVEKTPRKAYIGMSEKKIQKRSKVSPFVKKMNLIHLLPVEHAAKLSLEQNSGITEGLDAWEKNPALRKKTIRALRSLMEESYSKGENEWLFSKLAV